MPDLISPKPIRTVEKAVVERRRFALSVSIKSKHKISRTSATKCGAEGIVKNLGLPVAWYETEPQSTDLASGCRLGAEI